MWYVWGEKVTMYLPLADPVWFLISSAMDLIYRYNKDVLCFHWNILDVFGASILRGRNKQIQIIYYNSSLLIK